MEVALQVAEEDVVVMLDVIVEVALREVDDDVLVEEENVGEELVLALVLLVDNEHADKVVMDEVLVLLLVVRGAWGQGTSA